MFELGSMAQSLSSLLLNASEHMDPKRQYPKFQQKLSMV